MDRRPDVLVISRLVLDEMVPPDGGPGPLVLGGSGFWAALGAASLANDVVLASKVGRDLDPFRPRLAALGIGQAALVTAGPHTSRTRIRYVHGDERVEEPVPDWAAHVRLRSMLADVPEPLRSARACYVFRDLHPGFWEPFLAHLTTSGSLFMWEVPASVCRPDPAALTRTILGRAAIVSVNRTEAANLVGPRSPAATVRALHALGPAVVVLRCGADGSVVSDGDGMVRLSSARVDAVDPTGAGNAYSGAFLAARAAGADLVRAGRVATAAAAVAVERVGPPRDRAALRSRVGELARTVADQGVEP